MRNVVGSWRALFSDVYPAGAGLAGLDVTFGWRELALVHTFRPAGLFGAFSGQMR
jgi:hypothetical protein